MSQVLIKKSTKNDIDDILKLIEKKIWNKINKPRQVTHKAERLFYFKKD